MWQCRFVVFCFDMHVVDGDVDVDRFLRRNVLSGVAGTLVRRKAAKGSGWPAVYLVQPAVWYTLSWQPGAGVGKRAENLTTTRVEEYAHFFPSSFRPDIQLSCFARQKRKGTKIRLTTHWNSRQYSGCKPKAVESLFNLASCFLPSFCLFRSFAARPPRSCSTSRSACSFLPARRGEACGSTRSE